MPPPQFFHHPFIGSVSSNPCYCVTPTEMANDFLLLLGDDKNDLIQTDNDHDGRTADAKQQHRHRHHRLPFLPQSQSEQQRKRKERSSIDYSLTAAPFEASSSMITSPQSQAAKFQKTRDDVRFESVLDRPFIYITQLDQVLLEALSLFDPAWKNSHARKRLITHLIHFLELKVGLDAHISNNILMPTRVIEQAWRALVLEASLYQQVTYYIQDFHCRPRKIIPYFSSLRRQQLTPPHEVRDLLNRTQSFFMCYFHECMPESIKDELPIQEVVPRRHLSEEDSSSSNNKPPGIFLLPRFAKKKTTSYAMVDLQQPVLADAIIEEEDSDDDSDEDEDEDLLGLDFLTAEKHRAMQEEEYNDEEAMNMDTTCASAPTRSTTPSEEEEILLLPMLEEGDNEHKKNNNYEKEQQETTTSTTMDIVAFDATTSTTRPTISCPVPMTPVPSSTSTPAVLYSGSPWKMLQQQQQQQHEHEHKKFSFDEHDDGTATASTAMDTTITVTTTTASVVAPTITAPAIYNSAAAATPLLVECHSKTSKHKKKNTTTTSIGGGDIPRVIYTPGSGKPPAIYSGKSLQRLQQQHNEKMMMTTMYSGTPL